MRRQTDDQVIILGSGIGGLLAGTLLARKGRSVLLLREDGYRTSYLRNGYRFVPFSSFSDRLLKPSVLQKVSGILDLPSPAGGESVERRTGTDPSGSKREAAFQVILPEARVDLFCRPSLREGEWRREFPGEFARIRTFYDELAEEHLLLKKKEEKKESFALFPVRPGSSVKRLITSALPSGRRMDEKLSSFSTEFQKFTELQLISWGSLVPERFPVPLAAYLLANEECDGWIDDLCPERLQEKALESFLRSGGRLVEIEGVEKIEKRWKRGVTLSTGGGLGIFQGKMLILNSPLHRFFSLLNKKEKCLFRWRERIEPRFLLLAACLGIDERVIPVGMKDLLVSIRDLDGPYEGGNLLLLSFSPKGDETAAPEGKRALTVQSLISLKGTGESPREGWREGLDKGLFEQHQSGVLSHLRQLIPFLEKYTEFIDFEWGSEQVLRWSYPHFLFETASDFNWREGVIPTRLSGNLYFLGKENFPYLGLEGEILGGLLAAKQILQKD